MAADTPSKKSVAASPGPAGEHAGGHAHGAAPLRLYLGVYAALLVFTVVTVAVSVANLGPVSIYIAMAIAVVKATIVATWFMHLRHDERLNSFVLVTSVAFLVLFFAFTMMDVATRDRLLPEKGNFALHPERAEADARARAQAEGGHAAEH